MNDINSWESFIDYLTEEVDFRSSTGLPDEFRKVEAALSQFAKHPDEIRRRVSDVVNDDETFDRYAREMRTTRVFMDKYVLYTHPERDFVVRMHRFRPTCKADRGDPVHAHEWGMATVLLRGTYIERRFNLEELDLDTGRAVVSLNEEIRFRAGDTNSLMSDTPHQVVNTAEDESVITLFVRGKSEPRSHLNFDVPNNRVYINNRANDHLRQNMLEVSQFESYTM